MQGPITDDGLRTAGSRKYRIRFENSARLTFADRFSRTGAAGRPKSQRSNGICPTIRAAAGRFLRQLGIGALAAIASVGAAGKVDAAIVSYGRTNYQSHSIDSRLGGYAGQQKRYSLRGQLGLSRGPRDLTARYLTAYHYAWWMEAEFNEGDNIEWIYYYSESQYKFLDETLYKLLGGNYLLGSVSDPSWHGFNDLYWAKDLGKSVVGLPEQDLSSQWVEMWGQFNFFNEPAQPGDQLSAYVGDIIVGEHVVGEEGWYNLTVLRDNPSTARRDGAAPGDTLAFGASNRRTGNTYAVEVLAGSPIWTYHGDRIRVDLNAVPEPSTITLFGLAALGVLLPRRRTQRLPG